MCFDHAVSLFEWCRPGGAGSDRHPVTCECGDISVKASVTSVSDADPLAVAADRLDELADTAELMGDDHTAGVLRERSSRLRVAAMNLLPPDSTTANGT